MMEPEIRDTKVADLAEIVTIHIEAFPNFFLTSLGRGFLYEMYKCFLQDDFMIFKVVENEKIIKGFVVGSLKPEALFRKMLIRRGYVFLFHSIKELIRNPIVVSKKLFYALKYRGERPANLINAALLSSIGVVPGETKNGYGSMLINAFCNEAFTRNANAVYLVTDMLENNIVNNFYLKNGFKIDSVFVQSKGRLMNRYIKDRNEKNI